MNLGRNTINQFKEKQTMKDYEKRTRHQIPACVHALIELLFILGYTVGPMKAYQIDKSWNRISIWFVCGFGCTKIKRVEAFLSSGSIIAGIVRRKVYWGVTIWGFKGEKYDVTSEDYIREGLTVPEQYEKGL